MIKILIQANSFSGVIEVVYGLPLIKDQLRRLELVDFRAAGIDDRQRAFVMAKVPLYYGDGWKEAWGTDKLRFTEEGVEYDFEEDFWKPYNKKVNKDRCVKLWGRLSKADKAAAVVGLGAYNRHLGQNQWKAKKDPENYFRLKMWETDWDNVTG